MTSPLHLIGHSEHDDRQRIVNAVRAARIDQLAPDHREAVLAAERYLDSESPYGKATEHKLKRWRTGAPGLDWMSWGWVKSQR
jgi:hypothetical protein